ncbi:hypothetical protein ACIQVC_24045 [Streptomyces sp. NPDC101112]|jgi:hypothetical protein|uniref:hypothetical protein n=1 Tax=Streptomyces sp. NPDC101112 TaxID=3366105 RepID=UPI00380FCA6A
MTQPPGQPPYDGYGAQQPQQPPYPGPYGPPPGASGQAPGQPGPPPNPYTTAPQQPYGAGQPPYGAPGMPGAPGAPGVPNYGQQYGGYPPPPPSGGNGGKIALIVVAAVAALAVIGGGIFLLTSDDGDDTAAKPRQSVSARADESKTPTSEPTEEYSPTPEDTDSGGDASTAPRTGVEGQWQDDEARTLTIGKEQSSGDLQGQHALSYIDMVGGKGILTGVGKYRDENNFRMALRPMASENVDDKDITFATVRRSGNDVVITWEDGGGTDKLSYVGEASG